MKTVVIAFLALIAVGCGEQSATDLKQAAQTEQLASEAQKQVGMPGITNFTERKLMRKLYELRDQDKLVTYTYIVDLYGKLHFLTKSIGFGLPYGAQFTNPEKVVYGTSEGRLALPQPEPNGLFMPATADATWVMAIDDAGAIHPMYVEPHIIVSVTPIEAK